jgi:catechol 2,3-dioxygenase-like lactoylglutathione lyase family enzyme
MRNLAVPLPSPILDHVVIDARDRMDEAGQRFAELGFHLTPRGHHTLGSSNHLIMFETDYLELLGFGGAGKVRPELEPFPVGLNGLVFKTDDADAVYRHATEAGLPIQPVQDFSRPVVLAGDTSDASFRTTRLDPAQIAMGRVYFCQHKTPELVWRPEWQSHPNGAVAISRIIVATPDPERTAALFRALFGAEAVREQDGGLVLPAGGARVELTPPSAIAAEFGDAASIASERREYIAAVVLRTESLADTARFLRAVASVRAEPNRVVVPAATAFNALLVFAEEGQ